MEALEATGLQRPTLQGLLRATPQRVAKVSLEGFEPQLPRRLLSFPAKVRGGADRQSSNQLPGRSLTGASPAPKAGAPSAEARAGPLPAGLKPHFQGFLHLGHGGQGAVESLAEVSCLGPGDAVATIFLHMEHTRVPAGYIQFYGMKQKCSYSFA